MDGRREVMKKIALVPTSFAFTGCLVGDDSSPVTPPEERDRPCWETVSGNRVEKDPLFSVADEDEMMLPREEIHSAYEKIESDDYPLFDGYVYTTDYSHTILLKVDVYSSVDDAVKHYKEVTKDFDSPDNFSVGDEAVERNEKGFAEIVFRLSNAVGHVISYIPENAPEDPQNRMYPPRTRASAFANKLRDWWGGTSDYRKEPGFCREEILEETKAG